MQIFIILLAFSLSVTAQSPKSEEKKDKTVQVREEQEAKGPPSSPGRREKEKEALPRGPYKDGVYQYEWEKKEETGEMP